MSRIIGFSCILHEEDEILILGSMPSEESLRQHFYYANKTNRFWPMMAKVFNETANTREQQLALLKTHKIALWDVFHSCIRKGSMDADIKEVTPNDISLLLKTHPTIQKVICNGKKSEQLMKKYFKEISIKTCPSTSAANARYRLEDLVEIYGKELKKNG